MGSSFIMFKAILLACLVEYGSCCNMAFFQMLMGSMTTSPPSPTGSGTTNSPTTGCKCGEAKTVSKIVGGVATEAHEYPWQVGLSGGGSVPFCGGSLISNKHILTAAHCTQGGGDMFVLLGDHSPSALEVPVPIPSWRSWLRPCLTASAVLLIRPTPALISLTLCFVLLIQERTLAREILEAHL